MSNIIGPSVPPLVQLTAPATKQSLPETSLQTQSRTDSLSLSAHAVSASSSALESLKLLIGITEHPGGGLKCPDGNSLTPEQAMQRLSDGNEVLAKLNPVDRGARNVSALLFSLEDVQDLKAKIA